MASDVAVNTGVQELDSKINDWMRLDKNSDTRKQVECLLEAQRVEKLRAMMLERLVFGTAGIRGRMEAGFGRMNDLVIIQTSQGMARYMLEACPNVKENGVAIGFDGRYNSNRFASLVALAFRNVDIPVYLFSKMVPTPFIPYSIVKLGCDAGVVITASHNPKMDNGYKVYWGNGAQIISPHDKGIQNSILNNLEPWSTSEGGRDAWDTSRLESDPRTYDRYAEMCEAYMKDLGNMVMYRELNARSDMTFTYTAMHGVGYEFICKAVDVFGFSKPFIPVEEQIHPDPEFSTVKFPNPEEGKSALDLAMFTADVNDSAIILANDPDADRLAVAEKKPDGKWKVFTGNELGALLGWYCWHSFKEKNPDKDGSDVYMIASTVSSKILRAIGKKEGFHFIETLTGFKWMGNKMFELMKQGKTVLLSFEEAIGYMIGTNVLDKDGISAGMVVAEMATYLKHKNNSTLQQKLDDIYNTYGHHISNNSYYICHKQPTIASIFHRLRTWTGQVDTYPTKCGAFDVESVRDLTTGYDSAQPDNKAILPSSKNNQMITFTFTNGVIATIRTSGTEPKLKYYSEMCADPSKRKDQVVRLDGDITIIIRGGDRADLERELEDLVNGLVSEFLEPDKNQLISRPM